MANVLPGTSAWNTSVPSGIFCGCRPGIPQKRPQKLGSGPGTVFSAPGIFLALSFGRIATESVNIHVDKTTTGEVSTGQGGYKTRLIRTCIRNSDCMPGHEMKPYLLPVPLKYGIIRVSTAERDGSQTGSTRRREAETGKQGRKDLGLGRPERTDERALRTRRSPSTALKQIRIPRTNHRRSGASGPLPGETAAGMSPGDW